MNRKIKIVYFAHLKENEWEDIVLEQLWSLRGTKLYDIADKIYISLYCDNNQLKRIKQHIWAKFKKIEIINKFDVNTYEYPGLKAVYDISQDDESIILYFHTKGMTSANKHPGNHQIRKQLFKHTIENFELYINEFNKNPELDIGGVFPSEFGFMWYNFFWIRSSYVKNHLKIPETTGHRYFWERWIGNEHSTKKDIVTFSPVLGYQKLKNKPQLYVIKKNFFIGNL